MSHVFSAKDYNSGNGFLTRFWGPPLWTVLHTMSFNYPVKPTEQDKVDYYVFVHSLQNTLPCRACRENMTKNLEKHPLTPEALKSRRAFSKWMYSFHEVINKMLGKRSNLTYEQVRDRYEHFRAKCGQKKGAKEKGCVKAVSGIKSRCVITVVPDDGSSESFYVDKKCLWKKK